MPKVFISHSSKDRQFVERDLIPLLSQHGVETWYSKTDIQSGSDWERSIRDALKSCDWFLVVMSPQAQQSEWVRSEVAWAIEKRRGKVVPLLVEDCELSEINLRLTIVQHVDFRRADDSAKAGLLSIWGVDYGGDKTRRLSLYPAVLGPHNLGFEGPLVNGFPLGWFNSRFFVARVSPNYTVQLARRGEGGDGRCVRLSREKAGDGEFGSLMQRCVAGHLAGKTVRLEAEVRVSGLDHWAGLWLRADGECSTLFFDNMSRRPIRGTTDWTKHSIEAALPEETLWVNYGVLLVGSGELWADDFSVTYRDAEGRWVPYCQWCHWVPLDLRSSAAR